MLFDAKKLRFDETFELRDVSLLCKEERDDFEQVLRRRSIDNNNECVRDENRCNEHSSNDAYGSRTLLNYAQKSGRAK